MSSLLSAFHHPSSLADTVRQVVKRRLLGLLGLGIRSRIVVIATTSPGGSGGVLILHMYRIIIVKMDSFQGKLANATTK